MGRFLTPPGCDVRHHTDGSNLGTLLCTIRFEDNAGKVWEVLGFNTCPEMPCVGDGASVPPILWPIFGHPWDGDHARGGWLHDDGYQKAAPCSLWEAMVSPERKAVDLMFLEAVRADIADNRGNEEGVVADVWARVLPKWRLLSRAVRYALRKLADGDEAYAMYLGVRLGAWWAWYQHGRRNGAAVVTALSDR